MVMKILYSGPFGTGSLTEARRKALVEMGHDVTGLDQLAFLRGSPALFRKIQINLLIGPAITNYNREIVRLAQERKHDLIYVDQANLLWPQTVRALSATGAMVVHYTSEYFGFRRYTYRHLFKAVDLYDVHVITNTLCEPTLRAKGAKKIIYTRFGYDPTLHHPLQLTQEDIKKYGSDIVFVGHWEPWTEKMVAALCRAGLNVRVWGPKWWRGRSVPATARNPAVWGNEYVKILAASKIALCFLSKANFNQCASRTFEIPAIGAFMLAERTEEQVSYFREGEEAEFFGSADELVKKAKHYLEHDEERARIAGQGHKRCLSSRYTQLDRTQDVLTELGVAGDS